MTKIYTTQAQVEKDIKNGVLAIEGDVTFECSIIIPASIKVTDGNITAWNITADNINAWDINADDITAQDIRYHAFCSVYKSIKCKSIKAKRVVHSEPICLDGEITYKVDEPETVQIGDRKYSKSEVEERLKGLREIKEEL